MWSFPVFRCECGFSADFLFVLFYVAIQGKLVGHGVEEQLPTIAIVAHYDTYGIAPVLI